MCIAIFLFGKRVLGLVRGSGLLFTALYLKQCSSSLMTWYGGVPTSPSLLPVPISLTRGGLPRIIPTFHRKMMRRRDEKADRLVQVYFSFFGLAKLVKLAKPVRKSLFKSFITPADLESVTTHTSWYDENQFA